jgi:hypothetical protein
MKMQPFQSIRFVYIILISTALCSCGGGGGGGGGGGAGNAPNVQNTSITINILGVGASTISGTISANDTQGLTLSYSIQTNGSVGSASINATTGTFSYSISGHTTAASDAFFVSVSNGTTSSVARVDVSFGVDPLLKNQWYLQNLGDSSFSSVLPVRLQMV